MRKVSWMTDGDGNYLERWEDEHGGTVQLRIARRAGSTQPLDAIAAGYWRRIGVTQPATLPANYVGAAYAAL